MLEVVMQEDVSCRSNIREMFYIREVHCGQ